MDWITCESCGFTQIPSRVCLRCETPLPLPSETARPVARALPAAPPTTSLILRHRNLFVGALGALLLVLGLVVWDARSGARAGPAAPPLPTASASALDLSGRWGAQSPVRLPGRSPRPGLKDVFLETDPEGDIVAAGVVLTDPGRGGAGGGYRVVTDGARRLRETLAAVAGKPSGTALPIDFIPFPAWVPARERVWRVLEGASRRPEQVRYLLLESVEDDYLVQAGINETGFLSWVFFSRPYASDRGLDALSRVIHPEPGSSLRGFQNLVWDLSGSADFLTLQVNATVSGPEGVPLRFTLRR